MSAITEWVSPEQGCAYCHAEGEELSSNSLYTKVVARRMLQMTKHINAEWQPHVGATGVTCFTCHRGKNVPAKIWFTNPGPEAARGMAGNRAGPEPAAASGLRIAALRSVHPVPHARQPIRVVSTTALPRATRPRSRQTEWTYGPMMHMSEALGVNCTYCHNSRSFSAWDQSRPALPAWYGIRMVRDLNTAYLDPLQSDLPPQPAGAARRRTQGELCYLPPGRGQAAPRRQHAQGLSGAGRRQGREPVTGRAAGREEVLS